MHRKIPCRLILITMFLVAAAPVIAAPKAEIWSYWETHDPQSNETVKHQPWDQFQVKYVFPGADGIYRLDYDGVLPKDRQLLDRYVDTLAGVTVTGLNRNEQQAYWINLYNALTVQVVLDAYPVASIRDIDTSPGLFADGPWGQTLVEIESHPVSLDDIEHRILRPIWKDPRIHYAVNCASLGCPNLSGHAYRPSKLERQLDKAAEGFINHPRGAQVQDGKLMASSIYKWFVEDFGGTEDGVINHLRKYAYRDLLKSLEGVSAIDGYDYDWTLNDINPSFADKMRKRGS